MTRYATQTGHYVERRFGWDCHGLPVEHEIDKAFNIKTKQDLYKVFFFFKEMKKVLKKYCALRWESKTITKSAELLS